MLETEMEITNGDEGNTNSTSSPPKNQLYHWFFTFNNYMREDIEILETFFNTFCHKYCFQREIGKEGTSHLQGIISLHKRARWSEFGLPKTIHWEKPKNITQCYMYCSKLETRAPGTFPIVKNYTYEMPLSIITSLTPWMSELIDIISCPADKRKVHWRWESEGGVGKSSFAKYMCHHYNAIYIDEGKKADIINLIYKLKIINEKSIIVIDIPRDNGNNVSYKAIEQIKNGMICNTKYETGMRLFNSPHIIIFSNFPPNTDKLSLDRWDVKTLTQI